MQFWQHQCILGYTDFAPEVSVDDDSTKMLSVDILLKRQAHDYITIIRVWTLFTQRFCASQSTSNILAWITRLRQTYLIQYKIENRNKDQGTRTTHSKVREADVSAEVFPIPLLSWAFSVLCCLLSPKCWKRCSKTGFKVEAGEFWSRGRVELAAPSVLRVEGEPPRLDADPPRPW